MSTSSGPLTPSKRVNSKPLRRTPVTVKSKVKGVDLVTGKTTVEYYFDPTLVISGNSAGDAKSNKKQQKDDNQFFGSKHLYMPCTIIKPLDEEAARNANRVQTDPYDGPTLVKTSDGTLHKISSSAGLVALKSPDDYLGVDDVLHLPDISEASLLHSLKVRYKREDIYTAAGPILISINPYKSLNRPDGESIYSEDEMLFYRTRHTNYEDRRPHLFEIADRAYSALMDSVRDNHGPSIEDEDPVLAMEDQHVPGKVRNQAIIISGESGAGKTEATKIIMKFLARITRKPDKPSFITSPDGKMIAALEDRVLSSNPLLETFGNAQTLRNDNSSRFGKFIHINFDTDQGAISGATISNYLLEKTRITTQVEGERNYHIFYQLLSSGDDELIKELGLEGGTEGFEYLGKRSGIGAAAERYKTDFFETRSCLKSIGLVVEEQNAVFAIAAAVLHLGNIDFEEEEGGDNAIIAEASRPSLIKACSLLGLDEEKLSEAVLTKRLIVNGKTIKKPQNIALARDKRDSLAMMTYSSLFVWLVSRVNETLRGDGGPGPSKENQGFIGVLDIYGFECFDVNGFEQLLINYCNETLQRHFNRHLFEVEQELYSNEGVDWSYITFNDNRPCLELIEGGNGIVGILNTLDDSWGGMGSSSEKDVKFVAQLHKQFGGSQNGKVEDGHKNFITPKFGKDNQFIIIHYAGEVKYTADGFVEKNMDTLSNELRELGENSTKDIPRSVYEVNQVDGSSPTQRSSIRGISVGSQFRSSLQELVADLDRTQPHYIRCIKPNLSKAPNLFVPGEILKQLRYSGMMEAIRIRREGYALREEHESFFNRFSVLLSKSEISGTTTGIEQLVKVLSQRLHVTEADWQIGHSKIFLRMELANKLEKLADLRIRSAAKTLVKFGRHVVVSKLSKFLVAWMRFTLIMRKKRRETKAASFMAAWVRQCKQRRIFTRFISVVIKLQSAQRRKAAVERVRKIRDPYCDMTFQECKQLLDSEKGRLEEAAKAKKFRQAADLEKKVAALEQAVESKRPITRAILDAQINEINAQLDELASKKAYNECAPLQEKLEALLAKREEFPSEEELREKIVEAEEAVALAAKNKDFAAAAERQAELDSARQRLEDFLESERVGSDDKEEEKGDIMGFESRAQLEEEIKDISKQVQLAISSKDFAKASALQQSLDEKEGLRKFFPTVEEMEIQLLHAQEELEKVIANKDFAGAGKLNETISDLEKNIEAEKSKMAEVNGETDDKISIITLSGREMSFESRGELEKAITAMSKEVSAAVAKKEFKTADDIQKDVDELARLREKLPSIVELESILRAKKKDMDNAIKEKKFATADSLHSEIEVLEAKLKTERELLPPEATSVKSVPVVAKAASTNASVRSSVTTPLKTSIKSAKTPFEVSGPASGKTVKSLRPAKAFIGADSDSILDVVQMLASKRANAAVLIGVGGGLSGILTDTDVTRRVVAKDVESATTSVSQVMTPNPLCVALTDSAEEAFSMMVENRYRHLPVTDESGQVVGVLDIAKSLNDAIDKLERSAEKSNSNAADAVNQVLSQQGASEAQTAALQALLGNLVSKAFGETSIPTLGSLLAGKPTTIVSPSDNLRHVGAVMAENRKASLVVNDDGKLIGVFGFKDMMTRAVAKELPLESTPVEDVMTPDPETISPDMNALEALQLMHDHHFLTLPVCEDNGKVVGVVDVMDVIYGCGGAEGWRSLFGSAIDLDDDVSDVSSVGSASRKTNKSAQSAASTKKTSKKGPMSLSDALGKVDEIDERPVSKLRPNKPIISSTSDSITTVTQLLRSKRSPASIIVGEEGGLAGIVSDKDIVTRVVAKRVDPTVVPIEAVMTPSPICVNSNDSALESLTTMIEKRIRYLPVVDESGAIAGVLDISKCLNNAITRLEKDEEKQTVAMESAMSSVVGGNNSEHAEALKALLGNLLSLGTTTTTLEGILKSKPQTIVNSWTPVQDVADLMAKHRKPALVVDEGGALVGIFGFKDCMTRVVAKGLPIDTTQVSEVMTPNPEFSPPSTSVLEALQVMHDGKFLSLPVCEDDGTIVGVVDIMDLLQGCGGAEGWKKMFQSSMDADVDDNDSVVSENRSVGSRSYRTSDSTRKRVDSKPVSKLRPARPILSMTTESVLAVAKSLQKKRSSAGLLVGTDGDLAGIISDIDITRRVVAQNVDPASTPVSMVMTPDPICVTSSDPALDALMKMMEHHFRHLPVLDGQGSVVGLLDITKCLNEAIEKMEKAPSKPTSSTQDIVMQVMKQQGNQDQAAALNAILGTLMTQAFGESSIPTLRSILAGKPSTIVSPSTTVREVAYTMAEHRKAALVVDNDELVGVFGFKDMMSRVVAKELDIDETEVQDVMTPDPETILPEMTALEALQLMHDHHFLTLPVCEEDGRVLGVVDVMDVFYGCGGTDGWRKIFEKAMEMDDLSDTASAASASKTSVSKSRTNTRELKPVHETPIVARLPGHIPTTLEFDGEDDVIFNATSHDDLSSSIEQFIAQFKIVDPDGSTHRIKCVCKYDDLMSMASEKLGINIKSLKLKYTDDEGDFVDITTDDDVVEAWNTAKRSGMKMGKLTAVGAKGGAEDDLNNPLMILGVGLAVVGAAAFIVLRPRRY